MGDIDEKPVSGRTPVAVMGLLRPRIKFRDYRRECGLKPILPFSLCDLNLAQLSLSPVRLRS